jgi:hypothetical protein
MSAWKVGFKLDHGVPHVIDIGFINSLLGTSGPEIRKARRVGSGLSPSLRMTRSEPPPEGLVSSYGVLVV